MPFRLCKLRYETVGVEHSGLHAPEVHRLLLDSPAWIEEPVKLGMELHIEQSTWKVISIGEEVMDDHQQVITIDGKIKPHHKTLEQRISDLEKTLEVVEYRTR